MNNRRGIFRVFLLVVAIATILAASDGTASARQGRNVGTTVQTLTETEAATLSFMREEEKLARDVYQALFDIWGAPVFDTIAASEQRHMDSLLNLLTRYSLPDPAMGAGAFSSESNLQGLFEELVAYGSESLDAALEVGIRIEKLDIGDLQNAMSETDKRDILNVYGNLLNGSENHLAAFTKLSD